jgi:hypothetical protein
MGLPWNARCTAGTCTVPSKLAAASALVLLLAGIPAGEAGIIPSESPPPPPPVYSFIEVGIVTPTPVRLRRQTSDDPVAPSNGMSVHWMECSRSIHSLLVAA